MPGDAFDVFLSHNSRDKPAVREIADSLGKRGLRVWLDERELVPGRTWQEGLEEAIETAKSAAVLVGRDGLGPWEVPEMRAALDESVRRKLPVIPVLLPGASDKPDLPLFLRAFTWVDLRDGLTEAAIDRLVWGITGKKPRQLHSGGVVTIIEPLDDETRQEILAVHSLNVLETKCAAFLRRGALAAAELACERLVELATQRRDDWRRAEGLKSLGDAYWRQGREGLARVRWRRSRLVFKRLNEHQEIDELDERLGRQSG